MSTVRNRDTKPELLVRSAIHKAGLRFSLHKKALPGCPDLVLPKYNTAIFVHGCFWHGHDCPRGKRPETRKSFWNAKLDKNQKRDRKNVEALRAMGWRVFVIWECEWESATRNVIRKLRAEK